MDQEEPVVQVGNQLFRGPLEPVQGTAVCFEERGPESSGDESRRDAGARNRLSFISKTDKAIVAKRVFLQPKASSDNARQSIRETQ